MPAIESTYALAPGQVLRRIAPPFSPDRPELYRRLNPPEPAERRADVPGNFLVHSRPDGLYLWGGTAGPGFSMADLIEFTLGRYPPELEGDTDQIAHRLRGDFVFRPGAADAEYLRDLTRIAAEATPGAALSITEVVFERQVVVLSGSWRYTPVDAAAAARPRPCLVLNVPAGPGVRTKGGAGRGDGVTFAGFLGRHIGRQVVVEAEGLPPRFSWQLNLSGSEPDPSERATHDPVGLALDRVQEQTGLTWSEQTRSVRRLIIRAAA